MIAILVSLGTLIVSGINVFLTSRGNKRKIEADVKSKSRIEWIQTVRNISAEYIASIYSISPILEKKYVWNEEIDDESLQKNLYNFLLQSARLRLYFANTTNFKGKMNAQGMLTFDPYEIEYMLNDNNNKEKNGKIQEYIMSFERLIEDYSKGHVDDSLKGNSKSVIALTYNVMKYTDNFTQIISIYLKIEWDRAKQGK